MPLVLKLITLLMLPITLTSCAKAQGALAPTGDKYEGYGAYLPDQNRQPSDAFLPDVEASSLEPIINYVDGLNMALTGDFSLIRANAYKDCGCLDITYRLAKLFHTATLIGGEYKLGSIKLLKDGINEKSFLVQVDRSDIKKVDKTSRVSARWSASEITNQFIVKKKGLVWLLSDIQ
jgi:hypothetical protein